MTDAKHHLKGGADHPFDQTDEEEERGTCKPATDWAHAAARGVIHNLCDRRKIKWGFDDIDEEVRIEIVESLAEIIREAAKGVKAQ